MSLVYRQIVQIFLIVSLFLLPKIAFAREITVLPSQISGLIPNEFGTESEAKLEIPRLTRHFLRKNFFTELTDGKLIESKFYEDFQFGDIQLEKSASTLCLEWDSQFLVQDLVDFGNPTLVKTLIYNCKSAGLQTIQSKLISNFLVSYEKHNEKCFRFLPPRSSEKRIQKIANHEIYFFFDIHSSYAYYKKDFVKSIQSLSNRNGLFLGLVTVKKDKVQFITPSTEHNEILRTIIDMTWQGTNQPDSVLGAIQSLRTRLNSGKMDSRKVFFLLSSSVKSKSNQIIQTINDLRQSNVESIIIIPNHSDFPTIREIQRIGRSTGSKVVGITEYQKLGTPDGYETIYLNQFTLYSSTEPMIPPFDWKAKSITGFDASLVRAAVDSVNPYNMHEAYSKITEKRVLEKEEVQTDITSLIEVETSLLPKDTDRYQSVLFSSNGEAIWLQLPVDLQLPTGKQITIQSTFVLDPLSSSGVRNIPYETQLLKTTQIYPRSLTLSPSKIKKTIELLKQSEMNIYLPGKIDIVKKR